MSDPGGFSEPGGLREPAGLREPGEDRARVAVGFDPDSDQGDEHPSFLVMMGLVALSVAITILVFFAIGYLFGRLFL